LHPFAQLIGEFEESEVVDALDADPFRQKFGGSNQCSSHQSILLSFLDFIIGKSRGAGKSDFTAYSRSRYSSLYGYAEDLLELYAELKLTQSILVGHSVSAMVGLLASLIEPEVAAGFQQGKLLI
jgi:sigma-B regulation protein RsbQ